MHLGIAYSVAISMRVELFHLQGRGSSGEMKYSPVVQVGCGSYYCLFSCLQGHAGAAVAYGSLLLRG